MNVASTLESFQALVVDKLPAGRVRLVDAACAIGALYIIIKTIQATRRRLKSTPLRGPPRPSFVYGVGKMLVDAPDSGALYEKWAEEFGGVYQVPWALGKSKLVLCDAKAISHFFAREAWTYVLTPMGEIATEAIVGRSILSAKRESHRRQRKALTPAFSNAAIRNLTPVFYDSAYKVKNIWDSLIESSGGCALIEAQKWMNHISLDTIGITGFSHDFGSLGGNPASVTEIFDSFGTGPAANMLLIVIAQTLPILIKLPSARTRLIERLNKTMEDISNVLLARTRKEKEAGNLGDKDEKSIIGLLIKSENEGTQLRLSTEEVVSQTKVLLLAGYETTSISLTWALIELSRNPEVQTKLREELLEFGADPTYDQLPNNLPYLDAVVHETLRLHPPLPEVTRMAAEDDVIPLSEPVRTRSGRLVDSVSVAKGTYITISMESINRSAALWGPDAKKFNPSRWLDEEGIPAKAKEVQGHRHLLTFIDGPRTCLGKGFAVAEFKIVLSVLVKNFTFELPNGPETQIELGRGILPRPKVVGEEGTAVPFRVRRVD